jgi:hypothetical protein
VSISGNNSITNQTKVAATLERFLLEMIQRQDINGLITPNVEVASCLGKKRICNTVSHPHCILR